MAVAKIDCPECGATLKPAKPLTPGKKVRCPKCDHVFVVPGAEDEEEQQAPARKAPAKAAASKAGRKATPAEEPAPPPKKKVDEDEEGGVYGVAQEPKLAGDAEDEEEGKPKIDYVPDLEVKNPRGPAVAALAIPSNGILGFGALLCIGSVVSFCIAIWPFLFTKWSSAVTPSEAKKVYEQRNPPSGPKNQKKEEESSFPDEDQIMEELQKKGNEKMLAIWDEMVDDDRQKRIIWACLSVVAAAYFLVTAYAAVRLQNVESYRWSMAAAIMGMITILGLPFGLIALTLLKKPEIQAAFEYEPE